MDPEKFDGIPEFLNVSRGYNFFISREEDSMSIDLNRATEANEEAKEVILDMFEYHSWDEGKIARGKQVRIVLENAVAVIIDNVPPCPDRTVAIRKLREARMDCNSAITHDGKY